MPCKHGGCVLFKHSHQPRGYCARHGTPTSSASTRRTNRRGHRLKRAWNPTAPSSDSENWGIFFVCVVCVVWCVVCVCACVHVMVVIVAVVVNVGVVRDDLLVFDAHHHKPPPSQPHHLVIKVPGERNGVPEPRHSLRLEEPCCIGGSPRPHLERADIVCSADEHICSQHLRHAQRCGLPW